MSYSFYVATPAAPRFEELLAGSGERGLRCWEIEDQQALAELAGPWPEGKILHFYLDGISTRSVEASFEEGSFQARILSGSCPEDYRLALDLVVEVAEARSARVESEEGETIAPGEVAHRFGDAWSDDHARQVARSIVAIAADSGDVLTMTGTTRDFYIGPRVGGELLAAGDAELPDLLFARMRRVMYPELAFAASVLAVTDRGGKTVKLAVFAPGVHYLFPWVEAFAVADNDQIFVPYDRLENLVEPGGLEWADERQALVRAVPDRAWPALIERARRVAYDPFAI